MSLKYEQCYALLKTQKFLRDLIAGVVPMKKSLLREVAHSCLRHFPPLNENGLPLFSKDEFTGKDGEAVKI